MECFRCTNERDFDRVAVFRSTGEVWGSVCLDCEAELVPPDSETLTVRMTACPFCGDSPDLLFPKWESLVENDDGSVDPEYTISLATPGICRRCVVGPETQASVMPADRFPTD